MPSPAVLAGARAAWGATLMLAPQAILQHCGDPPGRTIRLGARALGLRELAEAVLQLRYRSRKAARAYRAVDLSHGATMALLAARKPEYRTAALVSLTISLALGALD